MKSLKKCWLLIHVIVSTLNEVSSSNASTSLQLDLQHIDWLQELSNFLSFWKTLAKAGIEETRPSSLLMWVLNRGLEG